MTRKALKFLGYAAVVAIMSIAGIILGTLMVIGGLPLLFIAIVLDAVIFIVRPFMSEETKQILDRRMQ